MGGDGDYSKAAADDGGVNGEDELFTMTGEQVKTLARLVHLKEAQNMRTMNFHSRIHRSKYLQDSRNNYESAVGILDHIDDAQSKHQNDQERSKVLEHLYQFASVTVGTAFRMVWNIHFRAKYLEKIRAFAVEKQQALEGILSSSELSQEAKLVQIEELVKELTTHKQLSLNAMRSSLTPAARNFNIFWRKWRHPQPNMFEHMVYKYRKKVAAKKNQERVDLEEETDGTQPVDETEQEAEVTGEETAPEAEVTREPTPPVEEVTGENEDALLGTTEEIEAREGTLEAEQLLMKENAEAYNEIIVSSGMPSHANLVKIARGAGVALIVFQLGMIAWDTYESAHPLKTFTKDSTIMGTTLAAGLAGEAFVSFAATGLLALAGISATATIGASAFVLVASAVSGIGAAVAAGVFVTWLFSEFFESGGKVIPKKVVKPHPSTENLVVHFTPIVDGERLARQLTAATGPKA